jgi:hypothetical protein
LLSNPVIEDYELQELNSAGQSPVKVQDKEPGKKKKK